MINEMTSEQRKQQRKYSRLLDSTKIKVKIYELLIDRIQEEDMDKRNKISEEILNLKKKIDRIIKQTK